jgi:thiosulfate dehydrogenase
MRSFWLGLLALGGCTITASADGRDLMSATSVSNAPSNPFSCTTCHDLTATQNDYLPGYTLYNASNRPTFWGGNSETLLDAINQCVVDFMRGQPLKPDDEKARAMHVYLDSIAPDPSPSPLPLTVVPNIVDVPSGDPVHGKAVWLSGCANCHGDPHTGKGRISTVASLVPDDSIMAHGTDPKTGARPVCIEKVRHGKYFMVGGNMPLYPVERLSDDDLGALLGYLEQFGMPPYSP